MHHEPWNKGLKGYRKGISKSEEQKQKITQNKTKVTRLNKLL